MVISGGTERLGFGHIPVLGNDCVLPRGAARLMNRNQLREVAVTDSPQRVLSDEVKAGNKDKGKRVDRTAKMFAGHSVMIHRGHCGVVYYE